MAIIKRYVDKENFNLVIACIDLFLSDDSDSDSTRHWSHLKSDLIKYASVDSLDSDEIHLTATDAEFADYNLLLGFAIADPRVKVTHDYAEDIIAETNAYLWRMEDRRWERGAEQLKEINAKDALWTDEIDSMISSGQVKSSVIADQLGVKTGTVSARKRHLTAFKKAEESKDEAVKYVQAAVARANREYRDFSDFERKEVDFLMSLFDIQESEVGMPIDFQKRQTDDSIAD